MSLAKMFGVVAIGMPLTLFSTAQVAFLVREYVQTEMIDAPTADALPPFGRLHFIIWGEIPPMKWCTHLISYSPPAPPPPARPLPPCCAPLHPFASLSPLPARFGKTCETFIQYADYGASNIIL